MSHANYPETDDLLGAFADADLGDYAPGASQVASALLWAIATFRRDVDFAPFLAKKEATPRNFTLSDCGVLLLPVGMVEAPTSIRVDGIELFSQIDYWLEPANALEDGEPFTRIRFRFKRWSQVQGCQITAIWGMCRELPDDVWFGIIGLAAWKERETVQRRYSTAQIDQTNAAQLIKAKESGPLRVEYVTVDGTKNLDLGAMFEAWRALYDNCLIGRVNRNP